MPSRSAPAPYLARSDRGWRPRAGTMWSTNVEDAIVLTAGALEAGEARVERGPALMLVDRRRRELLGALVRLAGVEAQLTLASPTRPWVEEPAALPSSPPSPSSVGLTVDAGPIPLSALELSVRARNCLTRAGITTLGQLAVLTPRDLAGLEHLGRQTLAEIRDLLRSLNLSLAREPNPEPENLE